MRFCWVTSQLANFLWFSSSLGSHVGHALQMFLAPFSSHGSVWCPTLAPTMFSPSPSGHRWLLVPSHGCRGRVSFALLAKRSCEARYQIQEETCRSLEEAWDRDEEPPHQTLNVAPASWPCTWYVGTNTAVKLRRRRSPTPSGCNLWIHPGVPRRPMPWRQDLSISGLKLPSPPVSILAKAAARPHSSSSHDEDASQVFPQPFAGRGDTCPTEAQTRAAASCSIYLPPRSAQASSFATVS